KGVRKVGDVMMDAVMYNIKLAEDRYSLEKFKLKKKEYILSTIHRAENTNDKEKLKRIFEGFSNVEQKIVMPLHPRTANLIKEYGLQELVNKSNIEIIEPVSYLEMLLLEKNAAAIVTDSGGIQKEAYFSKVPCLTLREQTEWIETIEHGWNKLVDPQKDNLAEEIFNLKPGNDIDDLYGDGKAGDKIVNLIKQHYQN